MSKCIDVKVSCLLNCGREEKVYYYLGKENLLFGGCENSCGSVKCEKCGEINYAEAFDKFKNMIKEIAGGV